MEGSPMANDAPSVPLLDVNRDNQPLRDEFLAAVTEVIDSGRFLFGPDVSALERELAESTQVDHAVGCASGSDALLLGLMALGIGPGDEVVVPSFTFFASVSCITRLGATPVFVDIRPDTFNLDADQFATAITSKTRAVIPVHLFGQCAEIDRICRIAGDRDVAVVEDAAQAIGAAYHSRPAGSWGSVGCFSFYPTKNLGGMGDGGMMTTNARTIADQLRLLAGHGMRPRYCHQVIGINSRLDTMQAAVLRVKFRHLAEAVTARRDNADRYGELFREAGLVGGDQIKLPATDPAAFHVWNQYAIRVGGGKRDQIRTHLAKHNIGTEIYYPVPMHRQECFQDLKVDHDRLPETERASREVLNLPIFPGLTVEEQRGVVDTVADFYANAAKIAA